MNGRIRACLFLLFLAAVILRSGFAREPAIDPEAGRIRVIYFGDSWGAGSPCQYLDRDPMLLATPVPASSTHMGGIPNASRYIRLFMPRTFDLLASKFDVIILSDTLKFYYTATQLNWFRDAVKNRGRGVLMVGGREVQTGEWWSNPVEEALPVDWVPGKTYEKLFRAYPTDLENGFLKSLPWKNFPPYLGMNLGTLKGGASLLLRSDVQDYPVLAFWEYGNGAGLAHTPDWTPAWGGPLSQWEFYGDFAANLMYLAAGAEIPQDPYTMRDIREEFYRFDIQRGMILGMLEFVEKFGANIGPLEYKLSEIDGAKQQATRLYLKQEYGEVLDTMRAARTELDRVLALALKTKDKALFWIYASEAMAVMGTSLICGMAVWLLMIRRRLYRAVGTTRMVGLGS